MVCILPYVGWSSFFCSVLVVNTTPHQKHHIFNTTPLNTIKQKHTHTVHTYGSQYDMKEGSSLIAVV